MHNREEMDRPASMLMLCAEADLPLCRQLAKHLSALEQAEKLVLWHPGLALAGDERDEAARRLLAPDLRLVLALVSADFMADGADRADGGAQALLTRALRRHDQGDLRLVPVIARAFDWPASRLGGLSVLPADGRPLAAPEPRDEGFRQVAEGVRALLEGAPAQAPLRDPYRGLQAFEEEDEADFFGREELSRQLVQMVYKLRQERAPRILAVVGPSGSGKSSVARAGLVPLLRRQPPPDGRRRTSRC